LKNLAKAQLCILKFNWLYVIMYCFVYFPHFIPFSLQKIGKCFCMRSYNSQCYNKMEATAGFSTSNTFKIYLERFLICSTLHYMENFVLRCTKSEIGEYFCMRSYNQQCYDKMEAAARFSTSQRSRIYLERFFNCSTLRYMVNFVLCCIKSKIGEYFCMRSHNQQCYDKMKSTARFSVLQRSKIHLERIFNWSTLCYTVNFGLSIDFALCCMVDFALCCTVDFALHCTVDFALRYTGDFMLRCTKSLRCAIW